jgi:hypothetical protein
MPSIQELHGQTTDFQGDQLLLQDSRLATNTFGMDALYLLAPRTKFMFFVKFTRVGASSTSASSIVPSVSQDATSGQDMTKDLGFMVKSIERPKVVFETEVCNQYNRKRIVQKRVEYNPINIKFHDTVNNRVNRLFQSYFKYYFGDSSAPSYQQDIISGQLTYNNWGFIGSTLAGNLADYFSTISVYTVYGGWYDQYDLINPKIISYDPDDNDYAATAVGHEIGISVRYEAINYVATTQNLAANPGLVTMMGLDMSDFYEPETGPITAAQFGSGPGGLIDDSNLLINQGLAGNLAQNLITQTINTIKGGGSLSIGGIFSGALNTTIQTSLTQGGQLGAVYNLANTGTTTPLPIANSTTVPGLRGIGIAL